MGHHIVKALLRCPDTIVIAIGGRPEDTSNDLPQDDRLLFFPLNVFFTNDFNDIETAVNCAFARSNDAQLLSEAFDFTEKAIRKLEDSDVKSIINISSQGVYKRLPQGVLSTEESPIKPIDLYSMAKYASEKMFNISSIPHVTNVRLASLIMPQRFLYYFVKNAIKGEQFTVTAPNQYAALLDVRDAADAIAALALLSPEKRKGIYNLGIGTQYSLLEYATSVKEIGTRMGYNISFDIKDNGSDVCAGMDCSQIMNDTEWKPKFLKDEMIRDLFDFIDK